MKNTNRSIALKQAILELEKKQAIQEQGLKEHFKLTVESLKPANIVKSTLQDIASSSEIRKSVISAILGTISFFITRNAVKSSTSSSKSLFKSLLSGGILNLIENNTDLIQNIRQHLFHFFFKRHSS